MIRLRLELHAGHALTEFITAPNPPSSTAGDSNGLIEEIAAASGSTDGSNGRLPRANSLGAGSNPPPVRGVDPDLCNWSLEADVHSSFLRFSLVFDDVNKILRNHLRYVTPRASPSCREFDF